MFIFDIPNFSQFKHVYHHFQTAGRYWPNNPQPQPIALPGWLCQDRNFVVCAKRFTDVADYIYHCMSNSYRVEMFSTALKVAFFNTLHCFVCIWFVYTLRFGNILQALPRPGCFLHGTDKPWASYQIRKSTGYECAGNTGNVFPRELAIPACITTRAW